MPTLFEALTAQLKRDERVVLHAYQDSLGYWTIGTGRLVDERLGGGISMRENDILLANDIVSKKQALDAALPWATNLDEPRYGALLNMAFNMGVPRLMKFHGTLELMRTAQYAAAAVEAQNSLWFKQTGDRARRVCRQLASGIWQ